MSSRLLGSGFTSATLPPGGIIAQPDFSHSLSCRASEAFLGSEYVNYVASDQKFPIIERPYVKFPEIGKNSCFCRFGLIKLRIQGAPG